MKLFLFAMLSLLFSGLAMSMTIEEYYALAPEMEAARAAISTTIYAICTGSVIAFYLFGWEAPWILRLPIGLVFLLFLNQHATALTASWNTSWEAFYLMWANNDVCSDPTLGPIYEFTNFCAPQADGTVTAISEMKPEEAWQAKRSFIAALKEWNLFGQGFSRTAEVNLNPFSGLRILLISPTTTIPIFISVGVWFLLPSRSFFVRRGWLND